jgi:hypothetical protein
MIKSKRLIDDKKNKEKNIKDEIYFSTKYFN